MKALLYATSLLWLLTSPAIAQTPPTGCTLTHGDQPVLFTHGHRIRVQIGSYTHSFFLMSDKLTFQQATSFDGEGQMLKMMLNTMSAADLHGKPFRYGGEEVLEFNYYPNARQFVSLKTAERGTITVAKRDDELFDFDFDLTMADGAAFKGVCILPITDERK